MIMKKLLFALLLLYSCSKTETTLTNDEPVDGKVYDTIPVPIQKDSSIINIAK